MIRGAGPSSPVSESLLASASAALRLQQRNGSFPAGHNGPWNDPETPARNTAHWAQTLLYAHRITRHQPFLEAARRAGGYLQSGRLRPFNRSYLCRTSRSGKTLCNGLVGQAWAIEGLLALGSEFPDDEFLASAVAVLHAHRFCERNDAWETLEVTGENLGVNPTLNQQVWFGAMCLTAARVTGDPILEHRGRRFAGSLHRKIAQRPDGLIDHAFAVLPTASLIATKLRRRCAAAVQTRGWRMRRGRQFAPQELAEGYASFLLYGLALLFRESLTRGKDSPWNDRLTAIVRASIGFVDRNYPFGWGDGRPFRWSYNPVGIEMSFVLRTFQPILERAARAPEEWEQLQMSGYFDADRGLMARATDDPVTLAARLYEGCRL